MFNQFLGGTNMSRTVFRLPVVLAQTGLTRTDLYDKIKKGEPPSNPDKMIKVQVAADAKD